MMHRFYIFRKMQKKKEGGKLVVHYTKLTTIYFHFCSLLAFFPMHGLIIVCVCVHTHIYIQTHSLFYKLLLLKSIFLRHLKSYACI